MFEFIYREALLINSIILSSYLLLTSLKFSAARLKVLAAVFICIVISHTPFYLIMNNVQRYSFLSLVYTIACRKITNEKVSASCCIMAIFEFTMVVDRYANAGIETWLYIHFEKITLIIHSLIISSFFKWKLEWWWSALGFVTDHMRRLLHSVRHASRLCYDYINSKTYKTR